MIESLVLATHNKGKIAEMSSVLKPYVGTLLSANDIKFSEPEETGTTFAENALLKARSACKETGLPALADDSGLCVNALDGQPGIYSARWAGEDKDFDMAMGFIDTKLIDNDDRSAYFITVLALVFPDGQEHTFEGRVEGNLIWPPSGDKGFGYDPMFVQEGKRLTFGEMEPEEKRKISHRAKALEKLKDFMAA